MLMESIKYDRRRMVTMVSDTIEAGTEEAKK